MYGGVAADPGLRVSSASPFNARFADAVVPMN